MGSGLRVEAVGFIVGITLMTIVGVMRGFLQIF